jgi:hypothetical protein
MVVISLYHHFAVFHVAVLVISQYTHRSGPLPLHFAPGLRYKFSGRISVYKILVSFPRILFLRLSERKRFCYIAQYLIFGVFGSSRFDLLHFQS